MKQKNLHPLIRASIIIVGGLALSLIFRGLNPVISFLIVFTISQLIAETYNHVKEIKRLRKSYDPGLCDALVKTRKYRIAIDIITLLVWLALAIFAFLFFQEITMI